MQRYLLLSLLSLAAFETNSAYANLDNTRFVSFKAYEEIEIKTTDGKSVVLGKGNLTQRPQLRPTGDWRQIGRSFGLKENPALCGSQQIDDILSRIDSARKLISIVGRIERESRDELLPEEAKALAAMPLCDTMSEMLSALVKLVPNYPDRSPATGGSGGSGLMIVNSTLSNEGHGWVVVNTRLSDGKQAIIHTGHKVKGAFHYSDGLITKGEAAITAKITQQPFAVRKVLKKSLSERGDSGEMK